MGLYHTSAFRYDQILQQIFSIMLFKRSDNIEKCVTNIMWNNEDYTAKKLCSWFSKNSRQSLLVKESDHCGRNMKSFYLFIYFRTCTLSQQDWTPFWTKGCNLTRAGGIETFPSVFLLAVDGWGFNQDTLAPSNTWGLASKLERAGWPKASDANLSSSLYKPAGCDQETQPPRFPLVTPSPPHHLPNTDTQLGCPLTPGPFTLLLSQSTCF